MDKIKPLFTATATAVGGRNGHSESSDGIVAVDLSVPKEMGGPGKPGTATPEHLFAAGYAACFGGAIDFVAKHHKKDASKAIVTCAVSIGPREGGGFGLRDAIIGDLGGEEQLSTLEVLMVENAAVTTAVLRDMQCRWLRGEDVQVAQMATLENTFNRTAQVLGTSRRAKDVTPASMRTELMKRDETDEEA